MKPAHTRPEVAGHRNSAPFIVLLVILLGGCAGPVVGVEKIQSAPFVEAAHTYVLTSGTASISGRAWVERAGASITCELAGVRVFPVTDFTRERMTIIYGNANEGFRPAYETLSFKNEPPEFKKYFRSATCNQQGEFRLDNLASGDYYLVVGVVSKESVQALNGSYLMKRVTTTEGTEIKVELHH
jgi:hypothetical protein